MHDWVLESVSVNWGEGTLRLLGKDDQSCEFTLEAEGLTSLSASRNEPWGPSSSINEARGPNNLPSGLHRLELELQSGDTLVIEAKQITMPSGK